MNSPIGLRSWSTVLCCLAAIALSAEVSAQATTSALSGIVVDAAGDPLADVALSIGRTELSTKSDAAGRFLFANAPWGEVRLRARAVGYAPVDTLMQLQSGTSYSVRLQLRRFVPQLDTVRVQATLAYGKPARYRHTGRFDDFYERRAKRPGTFFTREDIERGGRNTVFELMSSVPGVIVGTRPGGIPYIRVSRCVGNSIRVGGPSPWLALYINGQRFRGAGPADVMDYLSQIKTADVETVEVYRGASQLPMEAVGDACAAVFVTTRFTAGSVLEKP